MLRRIGVHLRGHGIGYVALFIVLGGTALALPGRNTVDSGDIAKKAVKSGDLAKKAVKGKNIAKGAVKKGKIKDGAIATPKLADAAVTGAKADEASFEGLVKGDGRLISNSLTVAAHNGDFTDFPFPVILEIPGFGRANLITCNGDADLDRIRVQMIAADDAPQFLSVGEASAEDLPGGDISDPTFDSNAGLLETGGGGFLSVRGVSPAIGTASNFELQLSRGSGAESAGATLEIDVYNDSTNGDPLGQCRVAAQALIQE